jgi:CheY-like chemotaxis protein
MNTKPKNILLVEDHADTCAAMQYLFRTYGYDLTIANTLGQAKQFCIDSSFKFDTILCDLVLPDGDALEYPKWVKQHCPQVRLIGFTAHAMPHELQAMHDAGFELVVTKPVTPEAILAVLKL